MKRSPCGSADGQNAIVPTSSSETIQAMRRHLRDERRALPHHFALAGQEGYLTVGVYEDGRPGELFITMAKEGSYPIFFVTFLSVSERRRPTWNVISVNENRGLAVRYYVQRVPRRSSAWWRSIEMPHWLAKPPQIPYNPEPTRLRGVPVIVIRSSRGQRRDAANHLSGIIRKPSNRAITVASHGASFRPKDRGK